VQHCLPGAPAWAGDRLCIGVTNDAVGRLCQCQRDIWRELLPMLYDQYFSAIACALLREKRFDEMDAERKTY